MNEFKVLTVEVSATSRKDWLARRREQSRGGTATVATTASSSSAGGAVEDSGWSELFTKVNLGTDDAPDYAIQANFALYSLGFISAKGKNPSAGGGTGGSTTLGGLNDVLLTSLASDDMLVYNGTHWVNTPMSAIKPDLSAYATKAALQSVDLRLSNVETIFEADSDGAINKWSEVVAFLDGIEGDTLDSILSQFATMQWVENKGYITAAALAPYALATAIPTNNNQLANGAGYITSAALSGYATQSWVEAKKYLTAVTSAMVISALGYTPYNAANFTKTNIKSTLGISDWALASSKPSYSYTEISGTPTKLSQFTDDVVAGYYLPIRSTAKNAEKLGGQLPTYYATASALSTLSDTVTAFRTLFDSFFEQDETNNAIKAKLSLYSVGGISAKGSSGVSSGSGSGVSYNRLDSWDAYTTSMAGYVLSAALGYDLHTRLGVVERAGYATESWVLGKGYATTSDLDSRINALVNGAPAAYDTLKEIADVLAGNVNSIGDIITTLGTKADKATTLAGYGIADAYTTTQVDSKLGGYLLLSGGTLTGNVTAPTFIGNLQGNADSATSVDWSGVTNRGRVFDYLGVNTDQDQYGDGNYTNGIIYINKEENNSPIITPYTFGTVLQFGASAGQQQFFASSANTLHWRSRWWYGDWSNWREIAYYDSNVASATKLATPRTIWGQSFDGTANVNGVLTLSGDGIDTMVKTKNSSYELGFGCGSGGINRGIYDFNAGSWWIYRNENANTYIPQGYLGIGTTTPERTLHIVSTSNLQMMVESSDHVEASINYRAKNSILWRAGAGCMNVVNSFGIWNESLNTNAITILKSGFVGIGTLAPTWKLHVEGGSYVSGNAYVASSLFVDNNIYLAETDSNGAIYFGDDEYAFIKETPDDVMTIASNQGLILRVNHISDEGAVIRLDGPVRIGDAVLSWDATTNSLTLTHADGSTLCGIAASGHITAKA